MGWVEYRGVHHFPVEDFARPERENQGQKSTLSYTHTRSLCRSLFLSPEHRGVVHLPVERERESAREREIDRMREREQPTLPAPASDHVL